MWSKNSYRGNDWLDNSGLDRLLKDWDIQHILRPRQYKKETFEAEEDNKPI